jgi:hypothetical protein
VILNKKAAPHGYTKIVLLLSVVCLALINGVAFLIIFRGQAEIVRLQRQLAEHEQNSARLTALARAEAEAKIEAQRRVLQPQRIGSNVMLRPPAPFSAPLTRAEAEARIEAQRRLLQERANLAGNQFPSNSSGRVRSLISFTNRVVMPPPSLTREEADARVAAPQENREQFIQKPEPAEK